MRFGYPRHGWLTLFLGAIGCAAADAGEASDESGASSTEAENTSSATSPIDGTGDSPADDPAGPNSEGSSAGSSGTTGDPAQPCFEVPACDSAAPEVELALGWNHLESSAAANSGPAHHRGRDMFYRGADDHWILAKFAYGVTDWDIEDERVDVYLLRNCEGPWESLGPVTTTLEGDHETIEGVEDTGGRVYLQLAEADKLEVGRHRVHFVVRGDNSRTDAFIEVLPPDVSIFVSDVDGTLTTFETEEFTALLTGDLPAVRPFAPEALGHLVAHGMRPLYLTARPEFLTQRTRDFIAASDLPPGIVHTTLTGVGATGEAAIAYKSQEIEWLIERGLTPVYALGNTETDAAAYDAVDIQPLDHRIFVEYADAHGGRTITSYSEVVDEFAGLSDCE